MLLMKTDKSGLLNLMTWLNYQKLIMPTKNNFLITESDGLFLPNAMGLVN